jgi:acyl-CoA thioesterase-1
MSIAPFLTSCARRRLVAVAGLVALLGLAGCGGGGTPAPAGPAPERWVVLGSSTAAGVGAAPGQGWAALLGAHWAAEGVAIDNASRAGAVTFQALPVATPRPDGRPPTVPAMDVDTLLAAAPRVVILAFPSNDAMAGYGADETVANLLLLRSRAQARGAAVLVLSSQPRNDAGPAQRETQRATDEALAAGVGPCFVDVRSGLADADGRIAAAYSAGDGVHLNDAGHRWMFERVSAVLAAGACVRLGA